MGRLPGLDRLPYKFYKVTLHQVGLTLLEAINAMLEAGELGPSLLQGVVQLIPKKAGILTASQLWPITLLYTYYYYKLLTKMPSTRVLAVLATILRSSQLCSVRGRSIFEGQAAVFSEASIFTSVRYQAFS